MLLHPEKDARAILPSRFWKRKPSMQLHQFACTSLGFFVRSQKLQLFSTRLKTVVIELTSSPMPRQLASLLRHRPDPTQHHHVLRGPRHHKASTIAQKKVQYQILADLKHRAERPASQGVHYRMSNQVTLRKVSESRVRSQELRSLGAGEDPRLGSRAFPGLEVTELLGRPKRDVAKSKMDAPSSFRN